MSSQDYDKPGMISIIIPVLNEATALDGLLSTLQPWRDDGHEVIVVDGGSHDNTAAIARQFSDRVVVSEPGRARQMNAGADLANGDILWFLHADSVIPEQAAMLIEQALRQDTFWGRFDIRLSGHHRMLRVIESLMNYRSRVTGIATGDQGIFCHKEEFMRFGGYSNIPLMEDIDLSQRFRSVKRPACVDTPLVTSSRRWEEQGIIRTILKMWRLRLAFYYGADPRRLARQYGYEI